MLKINGTDIAVHPATFVPSVLDLDNGETSVRTADGRLNRDRIAVKRKVEMTWGLLTWPQISMIMKSMENQFFQFTYPDPMSGMYDTRTMYVGDRQAAFAIKRGNEILWSGLKLTLTEQ